MSFKHEKFLSNNQPVTTVMYKACVFGFGVKTCSLNSKCGQFFKEGGELVFFDTICMFQKSISINKNSKYCHN